jgi:hypothetical protein
LISKTGSAASTKQKHLVESEAQYNNARHTPALTHLQNAKVRDAPLLQHN